MSRTAMTLFFVGLVLCTGLAGACRSGSKTQRRASDNRTSAGSSGDARMSAKSLRPGQRAAAPATRRPPAPLTLSAVPITPQNRERLRIVGTVGGELLSRLAVSPDGRWLAGGSPHQLVIYDLETGTSLARVNLEPTLGGPVGSMGFSADGAHLLAAIGRSVLVLRTSDLKVILRVVQEQHPTVNARFAPDGQSVFVTTARARIERYALKTGPPMAVYTVPGAPPNQGVFNVRLSPDGRLLVASSGGTTFAWRVADGKVVHRAALSGEPLGVAAAPSGWTLVMSWAQECRLHRLVDGSRVGGTSSTVDPHGVAVSRDGRTVVVASRDGAKVLDPETGKVLRVLPGASQGVAVSLDGAWIATVGAAKLDVWRRSDGARLASLAPIPGGGHDATGPLLVDAKARFVIAQATNGHLGVWDVPSGRPRRVIEHHRGVVRRVDLAADGKRLVTLVNKAPASRILLWRLFARDDKPYAVIDAATVTSFALTPDGSALATAHRSAVPGQRSARGSIRLWNLATGRPLRKGDLLRTQGEIRDLAYAPDGKHLVVASAPDEVSVYSIGAQSRRVRRLPKNASPVLSAAVSPDGKRVAAGDRDMGVTVWRLADGAYERFLEIERAAVGRLAFSPDGRFLLVDGSEARYYSFDTKTWRRTEHFQSGGEADIQAMAWSADSRLFGVADTSLVQLVAPGSKGTRVFHGASVAFSRDLRFFAIASRTGLVQLWGIPSRGAQ